MTEPRSTIAFISLGANIQPEKNLPAAVHLLSKQVDLLRVSSVWQSDPVGFLDQPPFLNAAVLIKTTLEARTLKFDVLRSIEKKLGRERDPLNKNAPRTIDLDIALFGNQIIDEDGVQIPDPEIEARAFQACPLAELDRDYRHPVHSRKLWEIAGSVPGLHDLVLRDDISLLEEL